MYRKDNSPENTLIFAIFIPSAASRKVKTLYYQCPVCGYGQMPDPPQDFNICPSCGTEFGYHDSSKSHRSLRNKWLTKGAKWFSFATPRPDYWNGFLQVVMADLPFDVDTPHNTFQEINVPVPGDDTPEMLLAKT